MSACKPQEHARKAFGSPILTDGNSEKVDMWLRAGGGTAVSLPLVLDALRRPDGLPLLLQAANAVAASTKPENERESLFHGMGHIGEVPTQVTAYQRSAKLTGLKHICEIGFSAGHNAIAFLHMNPNHAKYTAFDMGQPWSPRAKEFVEYLFPGRVTYIQGDSVSQVKAFVAEIKSGARERCDLFSVDGDHGDIIPFQDFINARDASVDGGYILADDTTTSFPGVGQAWEKAKAEGWIEELNCTGIEMKVNGYAKGWCYGRFSKVEGQHKQNSVDRNRDVQTISDVPGAHSIEPNLHKRMDSTIHIALSVCGDRGYEALISLKSALLLMNSVSTYEFHIFTDGSLLVETAFSKHVKKANQFHSGHENVRYKFYEIDMSNEIQSLFRPCSANRLIMPEQLHNISQFIYVDTDIIWLEDPANIFQEFSKFDGSQELGFAYEIENDAFDEASYYNHVNYSLPIFGPNGINAGVALFRVKNPKRTCAEFREIAAKYRSQIHLGDQDVLNYYGNSHPEQIFRLECQYNRRTDSKCKNYTKGILHGNRLVFHADLVKPFSEYPLRFNLVKSIPVPGFDDGLLD